MEEIIKYRKCSGIYSHSMSRNSPDLLTLSLLSLANHHMQNLRLATSVLSLKPGSAPYPALLTVITNQMLFASLQTLHHFVLFKSYYNMPSICLTKKQAIIHIYIESRQFPVNDCLKWNFGSTWEEFNIVLLKCSHGVAIQPTIHHLLSSTRPW